MRVDTHVHLRLRAGVELVVRHPRQPAQPAADSLFRMGQAFADAIREVPRSRVILTHRALAGQLGARQLPLLYPTATMRLSDIP